LRGDYLGASVIYSPVAGLLVFACVFGAAWLAMRLRAVYPKSHLSAETENTVKLATGLVATMAAMVLGLLLSSAKGKYDTEKSEVTQMAARIVLLDRMLANYGAETGQARERLRHVVEGMLARIWPDSKSQLSQLDPAALSADSVYEAIQKLSPQNDSQRELKSQILAIAVELGQTRWLLFEQTDTSIAMPLLATVVCWLAVIFFGFGLFAPSNTTVFVMLMLSALSVSGAVFMIMELDQPFGGMLHISSQSIQTALSHLGQ
jgi:hypothetical protein